MDTLAIRFFTGQIVARGRPVVVPDKEAQLLFTVAAAQPAISADRIADRLWPDADGDAAQNSFHVCLHRLRRHLDCGPLVTHTGRNYTLCDGIDVDLHHLLRHVNAGLPSVALTELFFREIAGGRAARDGLGEWFESFNMVVIENFERCAHRLCEDALNVHDFRRAARYARELLRDLPGDDWCHDVLSTCNAAVTGAGA